MTQDKEPHPPSTFGKWSKPFIYCLLLVLWLSCCITPNPKKAKLLRVPRNAVESPHTMALRPPGHLPANTAPLLGNRVGRHQVSTLTHVLILPKEGRHGARALKTGEIREG